MLRLLALGTCVLACSPLSAAASPDVLWVELAPDLRCPEPRAVVAALEVRLAPMRVETRDAARGGLQLTLTTHGARGLSLRLERDGGVLVQRTFEASAHECRELAYTLALITESWLHTPAATPSTPAPVAAVPTAAAPTALAAKAPEPLSQRALPAPAATPAQPLLTAPELATAAATAQAMPEAKGDDPRSGLRDTGTQADRAPHEAALPDYGLSLEAAVGASLALDHNPAPVAAARIGLEGHLERWLLGVRGHFETASELDSAGQISLRHSSLELAAGRRLLQGERHELALLLGAGLNFTSGQSIGYEKSGSVRSTTPLATLGLRGGWRPLSRLGLFAALDLAFDPQRRRFESENETIAESARAWPRLLLGASCHLF